MHPWQSEPIVAGTPVPKPHPIFAKIPPEAVEEELARFDTELKARREAEADKGRAAIDEEFAQREARESERMDAAYLDAKHALDNAFEAGHDAWLAEITQNTLAAL